MRRIVIHKQSFIQIVFYSSFFLFVFLAAFSQTLFFDNQTQSIYTILKLLSLVGAVVVVFLSFPIGSKNGLFWFAFIILFSIVGICSGDFIKIISIAIFMIAASSFNSKKILKMSFLAIIIVVFITLISVIFGYLPMNSYVQSGRIRSAIGFQYTTYLPNMFYTICLLLVALRGKNITFYELLIMFVINIILYSLTKTRAVLYNVSLLLLLVFFLKYSRLQKINTAKKIRYCFFLLALLAISFQIFYNSNNSVLLTFNKLFSNRLELGHQGFMEYGFSLFGKPIIWNSYNLTEGDYFYVDSSYLQIMLNYGFATLVFLLWLLTKLMIKCLKTRNYFLLVALLSVSIHSIGDPQLLSALNNPFLFVAATMYPLLNGTNKTDQIWKGKRT